MNHANGVFYFGNKEYKNIRIKEYMNISSYIYIFLEVFPIDKALC